MKIGYLGAGAWGFALASLLASKGYEVKLWTIDKDLAHRLNSGSDHPMLPGAKKQKTCQLMTDLKEVITDVDMIVESVTSAGVRPVFSQIKQIMMPLNSLSSPSSDSSNSSLSTSSAHLSSSSQSSTLSIPSCPIVITSKGIEQNTGMILTDIVAEVLGEGIRQQLGAISGPSYASEVIHGLPTSVIGTAYDTKVMELICETFTTESFRVYPNADIRGAAYGGALKNIIAIACGIAEGLQLGYSARAALMTRGLHEIQKLSTARGCKLETLYGLSGMGDLCVTCSAMTSRNFKYGYLLTQGRTPEEARKEIGMVVEGAYTAVSALQLSQQLNVPMPITEAVYRILYEGLAPRDAVKFLMQREIKPEHL